MTRKLRRNDSLSLVAPFITILILLIAAAMLAQTSAAGQTSGKANAVLAPAGASALAQEERSLAPWTGDGSSPVSRSQTKRHGALPTDSGPLFLPVVTYFSGGQDAYSVAVADVNGDGKPDLVVADLCNSKCKKNKDGVVAVLLGNGDGTFQPAVTYDTGGQTSRSVAVADLNGNGKLDLVVVSEGSGSVGVLLGNGDGTFRPVVTYSSGTQDPFNVVITDLNGDGKPDLVVSGAGGSAVSVLLGRGDGTFQPAVAYGSGGLGAAWVAVADVNGDSKLDLIVVNQASNVVGVLLGNGDGTFQPAVTYGSGGDQPTSVQISDLNGDGKPDLVVTNYVNTGNIGVFLGNGDGTFQPVVTFSSGGYDPYNIAVADVNGDGRPDLVVANTYSWAVGVLLGNGDGTFQPALTYDSGGELPVYVTVADVNGDGLPDLLVTNLTDSVGVLLHNNPTTTGLTSSLNPSAYGQPVTFTAAVSATSGTPTGTVIFYNGSTALGSATLANGSASLSTSSLAAGSHSITAAYQGFGAFEPSTSAPLDQVVNGIATTTSLASSLDPSIFGQSVTFTAVVSTASGTPTGTVIFYDGSTALGRVTLANGSVSLSTSSLAIGSHLITAAYQGSGVLEPSTSAPLSQVVNPATTTTSLASSQNPAVVSEPVTYTAVVASQYGGVVTGTVVFQDGGSTVATVTIVGNQATYTTEYKVAGVHAITAAYSGDTNNAGSVSATLVEQINKGFPSKTVLTTSGSPSFVGQPVTFTATVTSTHGTIPDAELVTYYDSSTAIGTGTTAGGVATFTTSSLTAKTHTIKATYDGDANFRPSTGSVTQVVDKNPTTTALSSSPNPSQSGQAVTFTATVTSAGPTPTGKVKFMDGAKALGSRTMSGGGATLTTSRLAVGTHSITAEYLGDADNATSTSPVLNQVVQ